MLGWIVIGFMVSLVMGWTGAGGGMVSLSLFLIFFDFSIQKSTVLSLLAIATSTSLHWVLFRKQAAYRLGLGLVFFSIFGSYAGVWLKANLSAIVQQGTIFAVLIFSAYLFWIKESNNSANQAVPVISRFKILACGLALGMFSTFTGFSGGIILMPLFLGLGLHINSALATSHFTACLASLASLLIQAEVWTDYRHFSVISPLIIGALFGVLFLQSLKRLIHPKQYSRLRRILFTIVVLTAATSILGNG
ncbi:MAG: sulfite exporter TauE/SafE family protein [Candidatus Cloacimonetes bacterium]|nr:sulfite exporter TauE/SafE family protein [Candidatus Cloacimonadota bacterium]